MAGRSRALQSSILSDELWTVSTILRHLVVPVCGCESGNARMARGAGSTSTRRPANRLPGELLVRLLALESFDGREAALSGREATGYICCPHLGAPGLMTELNENLGFWRDPREVLRSGSTDVGAINHPALFRNGVIRQTAATAAAPPKPRSACVRMKFVARGGANEAVLGMRMSHGKSA